MYVSKEKKLVFLQLRSPLVKVFFITTNSCGSPVFKLTLLQEHGKDFVEKLSQWIVERKFSEVVVLASLAAYERFGPQLSSGPFRYLTTSSDINQEMYFFW